MISVEELKQCKSATKDLIKAVNDRISEICTSGAERNPIDQGEFRFTYNGNSYDVIEVEDSSWEDGGKYQYSDTTYQLVSFDKEVKACPCDENIIDRYDLFLNIGVTRSGSYYSDYWYAYDVPTISIAKLKHIPEQIIPAHDEVEWEQL